MYRKENSATQLRLILELISAKDKKPSKGIIEQRCNDLISKIKEEIKSELSK